MQFSDRVTAAITRCLLRFNINGSMPLVLKQLKGAARGSCVGREAGLWLECKSSLAANGYF
jgi:hypothetical protein